MSRTGLIKAALAKLVDAVGLLSDAGEQNPAARLEDIIQQLEISLVENDEANPGSA